MCLDLSLHLNFTIITPDHHNRKLQLVARCDGRGGPPTHLFGRCGEKGGDLGGPCDPQARAASPTSAPPSGRRGPDLTQSTLPPQPSIFHRTSVVVDGDELSLSEENTYTCMNRGLRPMLLGTLNRGLPPCLSILHRMRAKTIESSVRLCVRACLRA